MSNVTNVVSEAIRLTNEANEAQAVSQAQCVVQSINEVMAVQGQNNARIEEFQKELLKINSQELTVSSIIGTLPESSNSATITKTVEAMNKSRQDNVKLTSTRLTQAIAALQDSNKFLDVRLAADREKLIAIKPAVVTADAIVG